MKISYCCLAAIASMFFILGSNSIYAQGSLTPPGAPAPTMKSLSEIEPRAAISSLPCVITNAGSYYLTTNVTSASYGIDVLSGNVTIDLNGFLLQGGSGSSYGIYIAGSYTNVTVRNGAVANWGSVGVDGYSFATPQNVVFENLNVSGCGSRAIAGSAGSVIRHCHAYGNTGLGIYSYAGVIEDCTAKGNGSIGIFGYNATIRNCQSESNTGAGFECNAGLVLHSGSFNNSSYGIRLESGGSARGCHVQGNTDAGIFVANNTPIRGGVIADCTVITNYYGINLSSHGYLVTANEVAYNAGAAILIQGSNNQIDGNHVIVRNGYYGFQLTGSTTYTNNVIVRNSSVAATDFDNYLITGTNNDLGPIGTAATSTSPWANFSHVASGL